MRSVLLACAVVLLVAGCSDGRDRRSTSAGPRCGDGVVEGAERCEPGLLGAQTCETLGFGPGALACGTGCRDFDLRACGAPASCGDGVIQAPELCDGPDVGDATCATLRAGSGDVACLANCGGFDTSACAVRDAGVVTRDGGAPAVRDGGPGDPCGGVTCSGHGICAVAMGEALCVCDEGYHAEGLTCVEDATGAPSIDSIVASPEGMTEGGQVTITAMVSDPDGASDIGGGSLSTLAGARVGTFTLVGPGTFELSVAWSDVHTLEPIEFAGEQMRTFVAEFFDNMGNRTNANVAIRLHCDALAAGGACDGACVAIDEDERCGGCNLTCRIPRAGGGTHFGECVSPGVCSVTDNIRQGSGGNCTQECAALGPGFTCNGATVRRYLVDDTTHPQSCAYVEGSMTYPTQAQIDDLYCECSVTGSPWQSYPKPVGQACESVCPAGLTCRLTTYEVTILASGTMEQGSDHCQAPYLRVNLENNRIGDVVTITDTDSSVFCDCQGAAVPR